MNGPDKNQPVHSRNLPGQPVRQDGLVRFFPVRHQQLRNWVTLPLGILLLLLSAASLLYGFFITWYAVQRFGRAVILQTLPVPMLIFTAALITGLVILITTLRYWKKGIELSPSGLTFQNGRSSKTIPWDSITRLDARINVVKFATSVIDIQSRAEIETDQGETFQITDKITNSRELIKRCRENVLPRLFHKYQRAIRRGEKITFHHDLVAAPQALLVRNMPYDWRDVEPVLKRKKIALQEKTTKRELISLPINQLENADILLTMLENPPS